jgi:hypothetical protein
MGIKLKRTVIAVAAVALLWTGPARASPPAQWSDAPDQDHMAILSGTGVDFVRRNPEGNGRAPRGDPEGNGRAEAASIPPGTFAWNAPYTLQSRVTFLDRAESHMNAVGGRVAKLPQIRRLVLPWQQEAITEVTSHATRVKADIQAAIVHLRENQNRLLVAEYRDHLTTIEDRSEDMKQTVDKFLNLSNALQCWLSVGVLCRVELSVCFSLSSCRGFLIVAGTIENCAFPTEFSDNHKDYHHLSQSEIGGEKRISRQ